MPTKDFEQNLTKIELPYTMAKELVRFYGRLVQADSFYKPCESPEFRTQVQRAYTAKGVEAAFDYLLSAVDSVDEKEPE